MIVLFIWRRMNLCSKWHRGAQTSCAWRTGLFWWWSIFVWGWVRRWNSDLFSQGRRTQECNSRWSDKTRCEEHIWSRSRDCVKGICKGKEGLHWQAAFCTCQGSSVWFSYVWVFGSEQYATVNHEWCWGRVRYFCKICHKFNHNTQDCWKNPNNQSKTTQGSADVGDCGDGEIGMAWTMWWC